MRCGYRSPGRLVYLVDAVTTPFALCPTLHAKRRRLCRSLGADTPASSSSVHRASLVRWYATHHPAERMSTVWIRIQKKPRPTSLRLRLAFAAEGVGAFDNNLIPNPADQDQDQDPNDDENGDEHEDENVGQGQRTKTRTRIAIHQPPPAARRPPTREEQPGSSRCSAVQFVHGAVFEVFPSPHGHPLSRVWFVPSFRSTFGLLDLWDFSERLGAQRRGCKFGRCSTVDGI